MRWLPGRAAAHRGGRAAGGGRHHPPQLEALREQDRLAEALLPVATLLPLPHLRLSEDDADRFRHGSRIEVAGAEGGGRLAVFDARNELLGIGSLAGGQLQPEKVIAAQGPT
jgi:tRNA U55 pseudouridine synthase TruB